MYSASKIKSSIAVKRSHTISCHATSRPALISSSMSQGKNTTCDEIRILPIGLMSSRYCFIFASGSNGSSAGFFSFFHSARVVLLVPFIWPASYFRRGCHFLPSSTTQRASSSGLLLFVVVSCRRERMRSASCA